MTCQRCYGPDNGTPRCDACERLDERDALRDEAALDNEPPAFGEADADYQHEAEYVPPSGLL